MSMIFAVGVFLGFAMEKGFQIPFEVVLNTWIDSKLFR